MMVENTQIFQLQLVTPSALSCRYLSQREWCLRVLRRFEYACLLQSRSSKGHPKCYQWSFPLVNAFRGYKSANTNTSLLYLLSSFEASPHTHCGSQSEYNRFRFFTSEPSSPTPLPWIAVVIMSCFSKYDAVYYRSIGVTQPICWITCAIHMLKSEIAMWMAISFFIRKVGCTEHTRGLALTVHIVGILEAKIQSMVRFIVSNAPLENLLIRCLGLSSIKPTDTLSPQNSNMTRILVWIQYEPTPPSTCLLLKAQTNAIASFPRMMSILAKKQVAVS